MNDSGVFKNGILSLPITYDTYMLTSIRTIFALFLVSFQYSDPPFYGYRIFKNNAGSLYELLPVEECLLSSILKICGLIRYQLYREIIFYRLLVD